MERQTSGMKCVNEDSRFSKVARMQAHNVNNNVLTQRLLMIFEKLQPFSTLINANEGFTNSFSAKAFIEKLSVVPLKKDS